MNKSENYRELFLYKKALLKHPKFSDEEEEGVEVQFYFDDELKELITKYNLPVKENFDNELEHIKAIMHWVNDNVLHDGYTQYRSGMNAASLLEYCIGTGDGVNCLMTAIIMQELCLAFGYSAHIIQGQPYDPKILDCHWIVNIYLPSFEKWATFDPVWCAYCSDLDGVPLSFFEIRNKLIQSSKFNIYEKTSCDYYYYLLCRYLFFIGHFKYNGLGTFDHPSQQKFFAAPINFDSQAHIDEKEKARFSSNDYDDYIFFGRHEAQAIHTNYLTSIK